MTTGKAINCLITSASAKVLLVEAFQKVLHPRGGKVITSDMDAQHDISLLIPTRDGELQQLARMKEKLSAIGVTVPLPDASVLALCQDKKDFQHYCAEKGFPVLPIADVSLENAFPIFMRHRNGTFTGGGVMVESLSAFRRLGVDMNDYVLQPYVNDRELSCDLLMDFDGKPVQAVVRERLKLVNGESWRSQIIDLPEVEKLALDVAADLGLHGHNLVQFFYNDQDGPRVIEVNARFGGCSNLSIQGGMASPERLDVVALCH